MKLRHGRGALAELDELFAYIGKDNRAAAAKLVARIEQATARIARRPSFVNEAISCLSSSFGGATRKHQHLGIVQRLSATGDATAARIKIILVRSIG